MTRPRFLRTYRSFVVAVGLTYLSLVAASLIAAHAIVLAWPSSPWPRQITSPITGFVEFVDEHWVAAIVLAAPLLLPLLAEIRKFVSKVVRVKYDKLELSVDVVQEETRKKPQRELAK